MNSKIRGGEPPLWARAVAWLLLVSMLGFTTGCDSGSRDFVVTPNNANLGQAPADGFFMGRVLLDSYAEGDRVTVQDLAGNDLYSLTTNSSGVFYSYGPLPQDFRILAVRPSENVVHSREIRGGYSGGTMWVNPMTTLVSRLMADSTLSLQEASNRVHDYLQVPRAFDEDWVTNSEASLFRPVVFYQQAEDNGGIGPYYDEVVAQMLSPTLNAEVVEGAAASFLKSIGGDLLGDTVSLLDAGAFGAVTQFFGLNLGTTGQLSAIESQLNTVITDLQNLEENLSVDTITGTYNDDRGDMEELSIPYITSFSSALQDAMDGTEAAPDVSTFLDIESSLEQVESYLIGSSTDNIIFTYAEYVLNSKNGMGLSSQDLERYQSYPIRKNSNTVLLQQNLQIYLNYLIQGLNCRAELAHMSVPPASELTSCLADFEDAAKVAFQALSQVPVQLSSDDFLIDLEDAHMLVAVFQPQDSYYNAYNIANNWEEGGYDDWRLPNRDEIEDFVQNRIGPAHSSDDNDGWEVGFTAFGFDTTHYGEQTFHGNHTIDSNTNTQGQAFFNVDSDSGIDNQDVYQWSGVDSAPATSFYDTSQDNTPGDKSAYLVYRTYANPDVEGSSEGGDPFGFATLPESGSLTISVSSVESQQLQAFTPLDAKGVATQPTQVTNRTYWTSSSPMATVSNYPGSYLGTVGPDPGPVGWITWHPPIDGSPLQPVTITGTLFGPSYGGGSGEAPQGVSSITGTLTISPPAGLTPNATSLQVVPFDQVGDEISNSFDVSSLAVGENRLFTVYATTFYADGQYHDVTNEAGTVYTLLDENNQVIDSSAEGGGFIDTTKNVLVLEKNLPPLAYTIQITYTTPTGQDLTGTLPFYVSGIDN